MSLLWLGRLILTCFISIQPSRLFFSPVTNDERPTDIRTLLLTGINTILKIIFFASEYRPIQLRTMLLTGFDTIIMTSLFPYDNFVAGHISDSWHTMHCISSSPCAKYNNDIYIHCMCNYLRYKVTKWRIVYFFIYICIQPFMKGIYWHIHKVYVVRWFDENFIYNSVNQFGHC